MMMMIDKRKEQESAEAISRLKMLARHLVVYIDVKENTTTRYT